MNKNCELNTSTNRETQPKTPALLKLSKGEKRLLYFILFILFIAAQILKRLKLL